MPGCFAEWDATHCVDSILAGDIARQKYNLSRSDWIYLYGGSIKQVETICLTC
jgi:hypothetical protein